MQLGLSCAQKNGCPLLDEYLLNLLKKVVIYFWFRWVFVAVHGLPLVVESGATLVAVASLVAEHGP